MKTYTISQLARQYGLSRSTLLYYDRIGLLPPSGRKPSGYRFYTAADRGRLDRIVGFRRAGFSLEDVRTMLECRGKPRARVIEKRLREAGDQIRDLKNQERLLYGMMKGVVSGKCPSSVDKAMWVDMLRAAGVSNESMNSWHAEFERRAPEAHHRFLISLGIPESEIIRIRKLSAAVSKRPNH